jgi:cytoskeletal protein CcmA (bactofilin family)
VANADKNATLSVSESGSIEGNVRVPNIVLNGQVVGDVHASERIQLAARARVTGNVYYKIIQMEGGATVNGQMVHETGEVLAAIGHAKPAGNEENPESAAAARMSAVKS